MRAGQGRVAVDVQTEGHTMKKLTPYLSRLQLATSNCSESKGSEKDGVCRLEYVGPLPSGKTSFFARATYDENVTIDSDPISLEIAPPPWTKAGACGMLVRKMRSLDCIKRFRMRKMRTHSHSLTTECTP
ncbi:MAG: hypothetical protein Q4D38_14420 [Planctomycetia bacterium]|nr:hypothetical protein [Planctomycetia bacterium]